MHGYIDTSMLQALFTVERQPSCIHHPALTQPAMVDEVDVWALFLILEYRLFIRPAYPDYHNSDELNIYPALLYQTSSYKKENQILKAFNQKCGVVC